MGRKGYSEDVRLRARAMWLAGNKTDTEIARELGLPRVDTIGEWRRAEHWEKEREHVQRVTEQRVQEAVAETIAEMNSRHLKEAQLLQTKGVQALRRLDPQKASEATTMIEAGLKAERLVRGEPSTIHELRGLMRTNVQVLEICVADVLKVLLENGQIDRRVAKQFADLFAQKVNDAPFQYVIDAQK